MEWDEIQRVGSRKAIVSLGLPLSLLEVVDRYAEAYFESNFTDAVVRLLREGLKAEAVTRKRA